MLNLPGAKWAFPGAKNKVVAIGASTGGTEAILAVVREFPATTPGVVMVQHMPPGFTQMFAERLDKLCAMQVKEAANGDRVYPGRILLAPGGDRHMRLMLDSQGYYVSLTTGVKVSGHCPSVDVLFDSVARSAGAKAVGVLLTGMGADGAANLLKMRRAGAYTIGQDEASCVVYGMPMVAQKLGAVVDELPLQAIPDAVVRRLMK
jgi:two-component system chemotaxis response regulator CheB